MEREKRTMRDGIREGEGESGGEEEGEGEMHFDNEDKEG